MCFTPFETKYISDVNHDTVTSEDDEVQDEVHCEEI